MAGVPGQPVYGLIRPAVRFAQSPAERALETGTKLARHPYQEARVV
ncbi:MAG: hypothetical protein M3Q03_03390 [Chloroflexota bacterium]|nr:hypothetical protein [Chloroflexota bacterium]